MMLYHACWDMMFLFGIWMDWYIGWPGRLWQQSICWVFILLSGFCVPLGHRTLKRGAQVFAAGALVTVVTLVFMPEDRVVFGVLTFLGSAMLLTGVLEPLLKKIPPAAAGGFGGAVCTDLSSGRALARLRRAAPCVAGCMVRELLYSVFRLSAFDFIPPIILPCCRGCFCSGQGTFCTAWWAGRGWNRCAVRSARRWAGWAGTRFCCICCTSR
mgnify:CR=1 FL=1